MSAATCTTETGFPHPASTTCPYGPEMASARATATSETCTGSMSWPPPPHSSSGWPDSTRQANVGKNLCTPAGPYGGPGSWPGPYTWYARTTVIFSPSHRARASPRSSAAPLVMAYGFGCPLCPVPICTTGMPYRAAVS